MKISLGSDQGGFEYKEAIKKHLIQKGFEVLDVGTFGKESVDYPVFGIKAARAVASGQAEYGIVVCTTGEGISIAANKVKGIRCGIGYDDAATEKTREHNDCNMGILWSTLVRSQKRQTVNIRDASLSSEELEAHAKSIATHHAVTSRKNYITLPIPRMNDNYTIILATYMKLNQDVQKRRVVPQSAEWLLDNFYMGDHCLCDAG